MPKMSENDLRIARTLVKDSPGEWEVFYNTEAGSEGSYPDYLHYIGKETDGSRIKIPEGLESCRGMFSWCEKLETPPVIPDGVKDCDCMFEGCSGLRTPPAIPDSVKSCNTMFGYCTWLRVPPVIPDGVKSCNGMFVECKRLTVPPVIPDSVEGRNEMLTDCPRIDTYLPNRISAAWTDWYYTSDNTRLDLSDEIQADINDEFVNAIMANSDKSLVGKNQVNAVFLDVSDELEYATMVFTNGDRVTLSGDVGPNSHMVPSPFSRAADIDNGGSFRVSANNSYPQFEGTILEAMKYDAYFTKDTAIMQMSLGLNGVREAGTFEHTMGKQDDDETTITLSVFKKFFDDYEGFKKDAMERHYDFSDSKLDAWRKVQMAVLEGRYSGEKSVDKQADNGKPRVRSDLVAAVLTDPDKDRVRVDFFRRQDSATPSQVASGNRHVNLNNHCNPTPVWMSKEQVDKIRSVGVESLYTDKKGKDIQTIAFAGNMRKMKSGNWIPDLDMISDTYVNRFGEERKVRAFDAAAYKCQQQNFAIAIKQNVAKYTESGLHFENQKDEQCEN